jgi:ATPase subunit of ABC transporter with duplicated ATPase domains
MQYAIVVNDLTFAWPDGQALFDGLTFAVGPGRTGLVGTNGSGKSTLLRLVAGDLPPGRGAVQIEGSLGYLRQDLTLDAGLPVDEVLGIAAARRALAAIEAGHGTDADFAAIGDDWDVDERARAALDRLGLHHIGLDRRVGEVSGGEAMLLGLASYLLHPPAVLLLDEPTNNLDLDARERLYDVVRGWSGVLVIVSHDRELLELVDQIAELRDGEVRFYGGTYSDYEAAIEAEQETALRLVRAAEGDMRRQQRDVIEARTRAERTARQGRKLADSGSLPRILAGARKRRAEVTAGRLSTMHAEKLEEARQRLTDAEDAVRDDDTIRVELPRTAVPTGRTVLTARAAKLRNGAVVDLDIRGPERIALLGPNGAGKTTLLETIVGTLTPAEGTVTPAVPLRYLPQRLDVLDPSATIAANAARLAPSATTNDIHAALARFLFRGARAGQLVGTLSGGERFRATLAALLLAEPAPQLLLLDEPTNNLDIASVRQLGQALSGYRGALIVASHDLPFLRTAGITRWLRLDGGLTEEDPQ